MSYRVAAASAAFMIGIGTAAAGPVSGVTWAGSNENGGLGGEFVFLNSNGVSPFKTPGSWSNWFIPDTVFSASIGGTTYSNTNDGGDIIFYGLPDTTSYGELFTAPGGNLTDFNFLIANNPGPGTGSEFVVATWNADGFRALAPIFSEPVTIPVGGPSTVDSGAINVALASGQQYVAFLTVANVVPEPSTWAMMLAGFVGLSVLGYRASRKANTAVA